MIQTPALSATELLLTEDGVLVRALYEKEQASALHCQVAALQIPSFSTDKSSECLIPASLMCGDGKEPVIHQTLSPENGAAVSFHHLCQARKDDKARFLFISDTQSRHDLHQHIASFIRELAGTGTVDFILNTGDLVQKGGRPEEWARYRDIASLYSAILPLVALPGNHEYRGDSQLINFKRHYGYNHSTHDLYYVLTQDQLALILLNSNIPNLTPDEKRRQTAWLESTLAQYAGQKEIVVAYHHPAYSSGLTTLFMREAPHFIRQNWLPLFQKYGVRLVLNGHDHVYEQLNVEGVPHLIAGAVAGHLGLTKPIKSSYSAKIVAGVRTVTVVTVESDRAIKVLTYDGLNKKLIHEFILAAPETPFSDKKTSSAALPAHEKS
jgi:hypothetical protein